MLVANATWVDHDPAAYAHLSETFDLDPIDPGKKYFGESSPDEPKLDLTVERIGDSDAWKIDLRIWDSARQPEAHGWGAVLADPADPIHLFAPTFVTLPFDDYQGCEIWG